MTPPSNVTIFCTWCGMRMDQHARYCYRCGAPLPSGVPLPSGASLPWGVPLPEGPPPGPEVWVPGPVVKRGRSRGRKVAIFVAVMVATLCVLGGTAAALHLAGVVDFGDLTGPGRQDADSGAEITSAAKSLYGQGTRLMESGMEAEAIDYFERAIQLNAGYADAWAAKGEAALSLGRPDEALVCFQTATQLDPSSSRAWAGAGRVYEALGRSTEAMRCYNQALRADRTNEVALRGKQALRDRGVPDDSGKPPSKTYDNTRPLRVSGGWATGGQVIHVKQGEKLQTALSVTGGSPPYYWYVVNTMGVVSAVSFEYSDDGGDVTLHATGARLSDLSTTKREAQLELRVEDSSFPTRQCDVSVWIALENNQDGAAIAARVASDWTRTNFEDFNQQLQQALTAGASARMTTSLSTPVRKTDTYHEVTVTFALSAQAAGYAARATMDAVLTINVDTEEVVDVTTGDVKVKVI